MSERFWAALPEVRQKQLFHLLMIWSIIGGLAFAILISHFFLPDATICLICDLLLLTVSLLGVVCVLNGKNKCAINMIFLVPVFLYGYYISEFSVHLPPIETVHLSTWWLIAGLVFLYFFSNNDGKILLYFLMSVITIGFQLFQGDHLVDSFTYFDPVVTNPFFVFLAFFLPTFYLRRRFNNVIERLKDTLQRQTVSLNRVIQNSTFLISRISAERDEGGNVVRLVIDKVNNAFESTFKLNLHEVQGQDADYVFNLIFKGKLDVNKTVLFNRKGISEIQALHIDKWFKIHVINPSYNLYYLIFEDITKAKKKMAELETAKRRYKVLLEAIPDIFFVIDKDGVYEDFVIKESDLFKVEDANIIGSSIFNTGFPENLANKVYACIQNCIRTNSIESIEYSLNTPNGTFLFEMRLAKLNANSVISVARDITKRKTAEFKLEKALKRAEESDRLKSAFLANLSHEIRTPMNIITNFTRMLSDAEMEQGDRLELTDAITENGKQLLNMIDNTIHLSKIETEAIEVRHSFCRVNGLIRDIYNQFAPHIPDSKDVRIRMNLDVHNPEFGFSTDNQLLKEALSILLDNALKYTSKGTVTIGYEMIRNEFVKFVVTDTGIGIPKEEFENIFSRFYRVPNVVNQSTSGSGIGLPIAQHYVALLGGELEFDSTLGQGSQFWFAIPFSEGQGYMRIVS
ncbi:ATP-binding protein [Maribellus sp. YY47]|uniref:PAS domain-containing sensor histidine kinase n=1 Tax=Maribellus sp. YY47 TaxID=2929486 RepID=UPI0020010AAB|nr:ATP-binding protein [Maribellus sp. YY47]MCK3685047.1 ATP-binding protein [Maribellus sp. YY47]